MRPSDVHLYQDLPIGPNSPRFLIFTTGLDGRWTYVYPPFASFGAIKLDLDASCRCWFAKSIHSRTVYAPPGD